MPRAAGDPGAANEVREPTFVFVGGLHRSGTSLVFRCLRQHPLVSGFRNSDAPEDEGQHLQSVYPPARVHGGPGRFGFRPAAHLTEASPLASRENAERLFTEWRPHWDTTRPVLLEKSPPNLISARFLQALFPRSRFVMVWRHPVAVAYATKKWSRTSLRSLLEHWLVCHETFLADRELLRDVLVVKYEHFVADPDAQLRAIYRFLELDPHPTSLAVEPDVNRAYFERWRRLGNWWPGKLYREALARRYEERVNRFGYSLLDLDRT